MHFQSPQFFPNPNSVDLQFLKHIPPSNVDHRQHYMDLSDLANKLGLSQSKHLLRKAAELRRLCDVQFDSSVIGVGEVCKALICLEIAATRLQVIFDRQAAIRISGMSEKAYNRSFNSLQNSIGVRTKLEIRELGIQFGCVRLIPFVKKGLALYKDRFLASLPASRQASADFTRPVFTAVAFYLCARKHKLKVDKLKLIEVCGTSESEFKSVATSMIDLCYDVFGISKEKKDPKEVKGHRELLDALPEKRKFEDGGYSSDDGPEGSCYKKHKRMEKVAYEEWKASVISSSNKSSADGCAGIPTLVLFMNPSSVPKDFSKLIFFVLFLGDCKKTRQTRLEFLKKGPEAAELEAS